MRLKKDLLFRRDEVVTKTSWSSPPKELDPGSAGVPPAFFKSRRDGGVPGSQLRGFSTFGAPQAGMMMKGRKKLYLLILLFFGCMVIV